jgi:hypothetical protein
LLDISKVIPYHISLWLQTLFLVPTKFNWKIPSYQIMQDQCSLAIMDIVCKIKKRFKLRQMWKWPPLQNQLFIEIPLRKMMCQMSLWLEPTIMTKTAYYWMLFSKPTNSIFTRAHCNSALLHPWKKPNTLSRKESFSELWQFYHQCHIEVIYLLGTGSVNGETKHVRTAPAKKGHQNVLK